MEGVVLFGDVVRSRGDSPRATAWLRTLTADLDEAYGPADRLAQFEFTQGDELQGLLAPTSDPTRAILRAALHPDRLPMRWVAVRGEVDAGEGPATQRSGPAFITARERLATAAARREPVVALRGEAWVDDLLAGLAPLLGELLADLTGRQRTIGRLLLVDGLRQAEAAARLTVSRATISVAANRAHLRSIGELARVIATLLRDEPMIPR
ncbi:MAG TPA: hypothetical protein VH440_13920 [Candidatus Limnocylindrales bacterium]